MNETKRMMNAEVAEKIKMKLSYLMKSASQPGWGHWKGLFPMWPRRWASRWVFLVKVLPQLTKWQMCRSLLIPSWQLGHKHGTVLPQGLPLLLIWAETEGIMSLPSSTASVLMLLFFSCSSASFLYLNITNYGVVDTWHEILLYLSTSGVMTT